jgi:hypothetical protein
LRKAKPFNTRKNTYTIMKYVHNVRVRITAGSSVLVAEGLAYAVTLAQREPNEAVATTIETVDEEVHGELYLDRQQPVRHFVRSLKAALGEEACAYIAANAGKYLDTSTHCFIHLDKKAFLAGTCVLAPPKNAVHIRLNIAAFPATKQNAIPLVEALFAPEANI